MASTSETGHGKNVANFANLLMAATGHGAQYNPSKTILTLTDCQTALNAAKTVMVGVNTAKGPYVQAIGTRATKFADLKKLCTRILNAAASSDAQLATVDAVTSLNKKIQGTRIGKTPTEAPAPPEGTPPTEDSGPKMRSTSQQSFDLILENFGKLATLLGTDSGYKPNEKELAAAALDDTFSDLESANSIANQKEQDYNKLLTERNKLLYTNTDSLYERHLNIKKYIKAVFGGRSVEYNAIGGLAFRKPVL